MPIKMQYPVQLAAETKCPSCNTPIVNIGPMIYSCQTGHVLEAIVLVTMRPKQKPEPVKVNAKPDTDVEALTPSYEEQKTKKAYEQ